MQSLGGGGGRGTAGWGPSAPGAPSLQPPEDDAAIVGAVRLLSVLIAALTMDLAGRKALLFVSGEHRPLTGTHSLLQQLPRVLPALTVGAPGGLGQTCPGGLRLPSVSPATGEGPGIQKGLLGLMGANELTVRHTLGVTGAQTRAGGELAALQEEASSHRRPEGDWATQGTGR